MNCQLFMILGGILFGFETQSLHFAHRKNPILSRCKSGRVSPGSLELPALQTDHNGTVSYTLTAFQLSETKMLDLCPSASGQVRSAPISHPVIFKYLPQFGRLSDDTTFRLENTVLLDNGYLSEGRGGHIRYYSVDEYCIHEISGQGVSKVITLKTCPSPATRVVLHKCCAPGLILNEDGTCISHSGLDSWKPKFFNEDCHKLMPYSEVDLIVIHNSLLMCDSWGTYVRDGSNVIFHPAKNGSLAYSRPSSSHWTFLKKPERYCVDQVLIGKVVENTAFLCTSNPFYFAHANRNTRGYV